MAGRLGPGIGETFGGYTIESVLGHGGMGTVYLATHARLERKVALKVIAAELAHDERFRARFLRESQLAASLDHPNVIPIYDADDVDGVLYLAMRYVSGPSLHALLRARHRLSPSEILRIAEQIGGALDAAHEAGLVHRDVKPANILIADPGGHSYLCDFGLAKRTSAEGATRTGFFLGTADYCSPEQIEGTTLDGRTDVYSLGGVVFHCLAGQPPYRRETEFAVLQAHMAEPPPALSDLRPDLPRGLDGALATALAKDPGARYATAGAFVGDLRRRLGEDADSERTRVAPAALATPPIDAAPTRDMRPVEPRSALRGGRWAGVAVAALVLLTGGATAAWLAISGTNGQSGTEAVQAAELRTFVDRIENILEQSAAGRGEIAVALTKGLDCTISTREAGRRIASVADNRQSILEQLGSLQAPSPQAADAVTLLQRAVQESIEADRHYRDAFFAVEPSAACPLPRNASFDLAAEADARATAAKARFVKAFNPLAKRFDRRTWSARQI